MVDGNEYVVKKFRSKIFESIIKQKKEIDFIIHNGKPNYPLV